MKRLAILLAATGVVCACKKEEEYKMGSAIVAFENNTAASLQLDGYPEGSSGTVEEHGETYLAWPASSFGTKLVQIYLNEDVAADGWTNSGQNAYIWINPACGTVTQENGSIVMANDGSCDTTAITDYFDFARPSEEVNADLNAQKIPVPVGTYRYVRVQVCDNTISDNNMIFASTAAGVTTPKEGRTGNCVMTPAPIDPPITIEEGESVSVSLNYDLSTALIDWYYDVEAGTRTATTPVPDSCATSETSDAVICVRDFSYEPSATKF